MLLPKFFLRVLRRLINLSPCYRNFRVTISTCVTRYTVESLRSQGHIPWFPESVFPWLLGRHIWEQITQGPMYIRPHTRFDYFDSHYVSFFAEKSFFRFFVCRKPRNHTLFGLVIITQSSSSPLAQIASAKEVRRSSKLNLAEVMDVREFFLRRSWWVNIKNSWYVTIHKTWSGSTVISIRSSLVYTFPNPRF